MCHICGQRVVIASSEFGVTADGSERRPQFMTGIGDKLTHSGLADMPSGQGVVDTL
ncbi:Uncharacterised protein [Mycobacteroides abscessus subsp. abscessus]|nr:Uncharacterised protein [Mycobacteroides abscessus subsp. abscessus]